MCLRTKTTKSTKFDLIFFRVLSKKKTVGLFFTKKVSTVMSQGYALSRSQENKTSNI